MVWTIWLATMVKKFGNQMPFGYQTFYHLNSKLLVKYSSHGLKRGPFDERTILDHLNTELVHYSDPHFSQELSDYQMVRYLNAIGIQWGARIQTDYQTSSVFGWFKVVRF